MTDESVLQILVGTFCAKGEITAQDVLQLRGQVFPDGIVSTAEAKAVFRLDQSCKIKDPDWTRFYVDVLTDYFVWQSNPRGYVSEEQAAQLIEEINRDGHVDATSELELLINIVHWCTHCPESLALLALEAIKESILSPGTACYGSNRPPAIITPSDVELIRKVIYAPGSPGGFTVTRGEAELLTTLDRATDAEDNVATWPDLFAKAVANALMFPRGAPIVPDAQEALRRERWLEERRGIGELLLGVGKALFKGDVPIREAAREVDVTGANRARAASEEDDAIFHDAMAREAIDREEAHWLIGKIGGAGGLTKGAVQLLRFIKNNSPSIDPALEPLFHKAGI
jgi:hypothetical protein